MRLTQLSSSLRTSETNYLNEAFSFYSAIRHRGYYCKASKEERAELMVKKLRYYARFIVVGLLLKKMKLVCDLVRVCTDHTWPVLRSPSFVHARLTVCAPFTGAGKAN